MAYSDVILSDSPIAYWRLGESGSTAADSSGNGHNGTYTNSPTQEAAALIVDANKAVTLDGVDQYINVPNWSGLAGTGALSVEAWIKTTDTGYNTIISFGNEDSGELIDIWWHSTGLRWDMFGPRASAESVTLSDGLPHHVVFTIPAGATNNQIKIYIDGAEIAPTYFGSASKNIVNFEPVRIGDGFPNNFGDFFNGTLDEVALYDTELTRSQVIKHYLAGLDDLSDYALDVLNDSPRVYWRAGETTFGTDLAADSSGYGNVGDHHNSGNCSSVTGGVVGDSNTATNFATPSGIYTSAGNGLSDWDSITEGTIEGLINLTTTTGADRFLGAVVPRYSDLNGCLSAWIDSGGILRGSAAYSGGASDQLVISTSGNLIGTGWHHVAITYASGVLKLYADGEEVGTGTDGSGGNMMMSGWANNGDPPSLRNMLYAGCTITNNQLSTSAPDHAWIDGALDEFVFFDRALTGTEIAARAAATGITFLTPYAPSLAISWDIQSTYTPVEIAIRWNIGTTYTPAPVNISWQIDETYTPSPVAITWDIAQSFSPTTIGIKWSIPQSSHFNGSAPTWGATVVIGATDVSTKLVGSTRIRAAENSSTLCTIEFVPDTGPINLEDWENQPVTVDYLGYDSGSVIYSARRYTGTSLRAEYDATTGLMAVEATTDVQGLFEGMTRDQVDLVIPDADYSVHVFDENADGWQYAQDRISTRLSGFWVDPQGFLRVASMSAKSTPDITFTDATRFGDTLDVVRASKSDLINKIRISMDFRFTRLRQREIGVNLQYAFGVCDYIINPFNALTRAQVAQAASSQGWYLMGEIYYEPMPGSGVFTCANPPGPAFPIIRVAGDQSALCFGFAYRAAKRFAQTRTETAVIDVQAPDSIEAVGELGFEEEYGLESEFDSSSWESEPFTEKRAGSVVFPSLDDVVDEDQISEASRADYEAAQVCAIAKAKAEIQRRHRSNRVIFSPKYRPDVDLLMTVRANAGNVQATGTVSAYDEILDFDAGRPSIEVTLAVSRHGGSGLASDDPIEAQPAPSAPSEDEALKQLNLGYHIGGDATSPLQKDDWTGFITNRQVPPNPNKLYDEQLVVEYPEVESEARNEALVSTSSIIEVAIDENELSMSR